MNVRFFLLVFKLSIVVKHFKHFSLLSDSANFALDIMILLSSVLKNMLYIWSSLLKQVLRITLPEAGKLNSA